MEEMLRMIYKEPGREPEVRDIPNTLDALQLAVGGFVEKVHIQTVDYKRGTIIICDDEGYLNGLEPNVLGICGPLLVCRTDGEDFASLKDWEIPGLLEKDFAL